MKGTHYYIWLAKKKKSEVREKMQNPALQLRTEFVLFKVKFYLPINDKYKHKHCAHAYIHLCQVIRFQSFIAEKNKF